MEHLQRYVALCHAVYKRVYRLLAVVGRERSRQPQTERILGHERRSAGQLCIIHDGGRRTAAADHIVFERLARDCEADARHRVGRGFKRNIAARVHEYAVAAVGQVERHALVALRRAGAAVRVPHLDRLSVLDERRELLAEAVYALADSERELFLNVRRRVVRFVEEARNHGASGRRHIVDYVRKRARAARRQLARDTGIVEELDSPAVAADTHRSAPRDKRHRFVVDYDVGREAVVSFQLEALAAARSGVVHDPHSDDIFEVGEERHLEVRTAERHAAVVDFGWRREQCDRMLVAPQDFIGFGGVVYVIALLFEPQSVVEYHIRTSSRFFITIQYRCCRFL